MDWSGAPVHAPWLFHLALGEAARYVPKRCHSASPLRCEPPTGALAGVEDRIRRVVTPAAQVSSLAAQSRMRWLRLRTNWIDACR